MASINSRSLILSMITLRKLKDFWQLHSDAEDSLRRWYRIAERAHWQSIVDTRREFPHADLAGVCTIFNIKGNSYRLISKIYYPTQVVLIRFVLTRVQYDRGGWKNDCEC